MNKILIAIFDDGKGADAGIHALRKLHTEGDITVYASSVIGKDSKGVITVLESSGQVPLGTGVGMAVGSMIGLLGGPVGVAVGAIAGTAIGAVRDFWVAGVGLDFIEEAQAHLQPGKFALVAEIEEEWVMPVDRALESLHAVVLRRSRSDLIEAQFDHDITAFQSEIRQLESESAHAGETAKAGLQLRLEKARTSLSKAVQSGKQRLDLIKSEAEGKAESLRLQVSLAKGEVKDKVEARFKQVKSSYHARGNKLSQAWELTKQAIAV